MRTTQKDLDTSAKVISKITGEEYYISTAYGRPRLVKREGHGTTDISPRLPAGQLMDWMNAYFLGLTKGIQIAVTDYEKKLA